MVGKRRDSVFYHFDEFKEPSTEPGKPDREKIKCKFCSWKATSNATRAKEHLLDSCKGCPEVIKTAVKNANPSFTSKPAKSSRRSNDHTTVDSENEELTEDQQPGFRSPTPSTSSRSSSKLKQVS